MQNRPGRRISLTMVAMAALLSATAAPAASFGDPADVDFARKLWQKMADKGLVGAGREPLEPFFAGADPHGRVLELARGSLEINDHTGIFRLKRSYDEAGTRVEKVRREPDAWLSFYTVMFRREAGYAPDTGNWFWAKFRPDGDLARKRIDGKAVPVAGRVSLKPDGGYGGCLFCHASAGGGDYTFYPEDRFSVFEQQKE